MGEGVDTELERFEARREVFDTIELVSPRALGAFDVAVELGPLRRQDEEAQVALSACVLELGPELRPAIDLDTLDAEGDLGDELIEEGCGAPRGCAAGDEGDGPLRHRVVSREVLDGLVGSDVDEEGVDLDEFARPDWLHALGQALGVAAREARLRTLLPIFRMLAFVVLAVLAVMMALSALGVEIGPLIASAGIVGVAVGFGSQTLVRDVISGIFYLSDDAFRVGEYIQSGSYKGTVESFSLRSVKLRHHRGPVYTVPFGQLGAVQNMSRDWVIDKMTIGVTYDSNIDKAKKLIKDIGKELAADPEFAPHVIEPLKMQGVEQFGDYAIQLRLKMMTKPNEQFVMRRRALSMIKRAFEENGIRFAFPTVHVGGSGDAVGAAAAEQVLAKGRLATTESMAKT